MVRRKFIAGNWKMNLDLADAIALTQSVGRGIASSGDVDVAVCPPSVYLHAVASAVENSAVQVGAQTVHPAESGAFTGEISARMAKDVGCQYVILGHSERRNLFGESNKDVNDRLQAVLAVGLTPIVCVGELLQQREAGQTQQVIQDQFEGSLAGISSEQASKIVIAYEPVWAIGTGKVATPEQAEQVHADLRKLLESQYNSEVAQRVRIQYGGSVKPDNATALLAQPNIDGALVGGASLQSDSFLAIIAAAQELAVA